jgi:hypothetical protein
VKISQRIGTVQVEVDGETLIEAFDQLAAATEVLGNNVCGSCQKTDVAYITRHNKGYTFREIECQACGCRLSIGLTKTNPPMLFPRRKEPKTNQWLPNDGWVPQESHDDTF